MASFVYTHAAALLLKADIDFDVDDIRVALLKTSGNTTADTELDVATIGAFTTVGEVVTTNYSSGGLALAGEIVNEDATNDRGEFDATDLVFTSLGTSVTDTIGAALVYKFVTNFTSSIPIAYIDLADTTTNGGNITLSWNAEGILQATCPQA